MSSPLVQFRLSQDEYDFLVRKGLDPSRAARERLSGLVRALRFDEDMKWIRHVRKSASVDVVAAAREARQDLEERP